MKQLHLREPWGNRDDPKSYGAKIHSGNGTDGPPQGNPWVTLGEIEKYNAPRAILQAISAAIGGSPYTRV
jgi:hypothetical protein